MMSLEEILNVLGVKLVNIHRFMPDNTLSVCIRQTGLTFLPVYNANRHINGALKIPYEDVTMKIEYFSEAGPHISEITIIDEKVEYTFSVQTMELRKNGKLLYRYNKYVPEYYFNQTFVNNEC